MDIIGKVAIVTGGSQGLGKSFSEILLRNGAKVCFTDINEEAGTTVKEQFENAYGRDSVFFIKCDVTSQKGMEDVFRRVKEKFGQLDIVCNNAGIGGETYPLWEKAVDVNVKGVIRGSMLALDHMRTDRGGHGGTIVNVSSMAAISPNPFGPVYAATKAAILHFTRSWAANPEIQQAGVRMHVLCPSFTDTALVSGLSEDTCYNLSAAKLFVNQTGIMSIEDVADAFLHLIKDERNSCGILSLTPLEGQQFLELRSVPLTE